jgi:hypothetical protein
LRSCFVLADTCVCLSRRTLLQAPSHHNFLPLADGN